MSRIALGGGSMMAAVAVVALAVLVASAGPALGVDYLTNNWAEVLLEVHPNERAPGIGVSPKLGTEPWTSSGISGPFYEWKVYTFCAGSSRYEDRDINCVRIDVCAQNFNSIQNSCGQDDRLWMKLDGVTPVAIYLAQNGPSGSYQWKGDLEHGNRKTLTFFFCSDCLPLGLDPGEHTLKFYAKNTPIIWWIKVTQRHCWYVEVSSPA